MKRMVVTILVAIVLAGCASSAINLTGGVVTVETKGSAIYSDKTLIDRARDAIQDVCDNGDNGSYKTQNLTGAQQKVVELSGLVGAIKSIFDHFPTSTVKLVESCQVKEKSTAPVAATR